MPRLLGSVGSDMELREGSYSYDNVGQPILAAAAFPGGLVLTCKNWRLCNTCRPLAARGSEPRPSGSGLRELLQVGTSSDSCRRAPASAVLVRYGGPEPTRAK